jgi:hypothetical protein
MRATIVQQEAMPDLRQNITATIRRGNRSSRAWGISQGSAMRSDNRRASCAIVLVLAVVAVFGMQAVRARVAAGQATAPAAPASQSGSLATIAGRVVMADAGRVVAGIRVRLMSMPAESAPPEPTAAGADVRDTEPDTAGSFAFSGLPPGRYIVLVNGPSGTWCPTSPITVNLSASETVRLELHLERTSTVSGRVVAENGPVPGIRVSLLSWNGPILGPRRLLPLVRPGLSSPAPSGVLTDGKGEFLLTDVAPGEYFLVAEDLSRRPPGQFEPRVALLRTYYPNSTQVASARPVTVRSGADVGGVEIRMTRDRLAQVSGRAVDSTGRPLPMGPAGSLSLYSASNAQVVPSTGVIFGSGLQRGASDGSFVFPDVVPGDYYLVASLLSTEDPGTGERPRSQITSSSNPAVRPGQKFWEREGAIVRVHVAERSSQKLDVRTNRGAVISGRVVVDGQPSAKPIDQDATLTIVTNSEEMLSSLSTGRRVPVRNGVFTVERLWGSMTMTVEAPGMAVTSVMCGTEDWTARSIALDGTERASDVVVTMTRDVASLEGIVTGVQGSVAVIVYPEDRSRWRLPHVTNPRTSGGESARLALTAGGAAPPAADPEKRQAYFSVPALLPGSYLVVAVPLRRDDGLPLDAWLETLTPRATRVTLAAGDHRRVTLSGPD